MAYRYHCDVQKSKLVQFPATFYLDELKNYKAVNIFLEF